MIVEKDWEKSLTGAFTVGEMGRLLYSRPVDIAQMASFAKRDSSLRTNVLLEYTKRGEWRKAAEVARCLQNLDRYILEEVVKVFGLVDTEKLFGDYLEDLPSILGTVKQEKISFQEQRYLVLVSYTDKLALLQILVMTGRGEIVLDRRLKTPIAVTGLPLVRSIPLPVIDEGSIRRNQVEAAIMRLVFEINAEESLGGRQKVISG